MFYGQWERLIDARGRTFIPARFRKELGKRVAIIQNSTSFLIYSQKKIKEINPGKTWFTKIDRQGRILIPGRFRQHLSEKQSVILIGRDNHFEVRLKEKREEIKVKVPHNRITLGAAQEFSRRGISVETDGDKKEATLISK